VTIAHGRQRAPSRRPAATAAKSAVRQAVRARNLRGKRGKRNARAKLCTAKQLFARQARFLALDSRGLWCYPAPTFP
jgi:hypothetical protein